jgi:hypothetical protein
MTGYRDAAKMLRQLIKNAANAESPIPAGHILALSEVFDDKADKIEIDMIVEMQRNAI